MLLLVLVLLLPTARQRRHTGSDKPWTTRPKAYRWRWIVRTLDVTCLTTPVLHATLLIRILLTKIRLERIRWPRPRLILTTLRIVNQIRILILITPGRRWTTELCHRRHVTQDRRRRRFIQLIRIRVKIQHNVLWTTDPHTITTNATTTTRATRATKSTEHTVHLGRRQRFMATVEISVVRDRGALLIGRPTNTTTENTSTRTTLPIRSTLGTPARHSLLAVQSRPSPAGPRTPTHDDAQDEKQQKTDGGTRTDNHQKVLLRERHLLDHRFLLHDHVQRVVGLDTAGRILRHTRVRPIILDVNVVDEQLAMLLPIHIIDVVVKVQVRHQQTLVQ
uniref:Putative secreted protein n=1 Tax=Anopheles darlingi TaxID=43151 RepID=A0A2M4D2B1_ANODA